MANVSKFDLGSFNSKSTTYLSFPFDFDLEVNEKY